MLLSQHDIQSADLSFDPPMIKRATNRKIYLIAARGMTRDVLALRIQEKLSKGIDLWPEHRRR